MHSRVATRRVAATWGVVVVALSVVTRLLSRHGVLSLKEKKVGGVDMAGM